MEYENVELLEQVLKFASAPACAVQNLWFKERKEAGFFVFL